MSHIKLFKREVEPSLYETLADQVLSGEVLTRHQARMILNAPKNDWKLILNATLRVREKYFGRKVKICVLRNAKSGNCPEDCHYCSQSAGSTSSIEKYKLQSKEELLEGAREAYEIGAKRYCIVLSGRGPSDRDIDYLVDTVKTIKNQYSLEICCSLGLLNEDKAKRLKSAGVGWINHNINTSERFYASICNTHTYQDRIKTLGAIKSAGLSTCSGGIVGLGENEEDILDFAFTTRELDFQSIPINFLHAIEGTPLRSQGKVDPILALKVLSLIRFLNPNKEVRAAGGREHNLGDMNKWVIYPANSIFVGGYLTMPGQAIQEARDFIKEMGFEVEI